jgi:WD40 repeat protein
VRAVVILSLAGAARWVQNILDQQIASGRAFSGIVFSPDGSLLATTTESTQSINVWPVESDESPRRYQLPNCTIHFLAFSPDGHQLLSSALESQHSVSDTHTDSARIDVWDPHEESNAEKTIFTGDSTVGDIGYTGASTAAAVSRGSVGAYDLTTGRLDGSLPLPPGTADKLAITTAGHVLVYGCPARSAEVSVYDATDQKFLFQASDVMPIIRDSAVSRDGKWFAVCGSAFGGGGRLRVWALGEGREIHSDAEVADLSGVRIFSDRRGVVTVDFDGFVTIWLVEYGRLVPADRFLVDGSVARLALSNDDRRVATASTRSLSVWNVDIGKRVRVFIELPKLYTIRKYVRYGSVAVLPLGALMFAWSLRRCIRLPARATQTYQG